MDIALAAPTGKAADRMTESVRTNVALTGLDEDVAEAVGDGRRYHAAPTSRGDRGRSIPA